MSVEWRAFWIAAPVTALVTSCSFLIVPTVLEPHDLHWADIAGVAEFIGAYTLVTLPFVIVAGAAVGLPIVALLRRIRLITLPALLIAGAVAGSLYSGLFLWGAIALEKTTMLFVFSSAIGVLPGLTAALIWWFLAERRRGARVHV